MEQAVYSRIANYSSWMFNYNALITIWQEQLWSLGMPSKEDRELENDAGEKQTIALAEAEL